MQEISRLNGGGNPIKLDFVKGEATQTEIVELTIRLRHVYLYFSKTVFILDIFGVDRAR